MAIIQKKSSKFAYVFKNNTHYLMIKIEKFIQLKAFARQDGMLTAILWTVSFACVTLGKAGSLGNILALATPFVIGWCLCKFRDTVLGGTISFRRAYAYGVYTFLYASLIFALVQFAYFRFLDKGMFAQAVNETISAVAPIYEANGMSKAQINETTNIVSILTPIQWSFMFMLQNIATGIAASIPIAAICKRKATK